MAKVLKFKDYLNERFLEYYKSSMTGQPFEVLVNPTKKELQKFTNIRYILDNKTKKVYAWNSLAEFHDTVWKKVGNTASVYGNKDIFSGEAMKTGNKYVTYGAVGLGEHHLKTDWSWARFIIHDIDNYIKQQLNRPER